MNEALDNELTYRITGLAIQVHKHLGPGLLKKGLPYSLRHELAQAELPFESQVPVPGLYRDTALDCGCIADIIVEKRVILELKSVEPILSLHEVQPLTYLRLAG